MKRTIRIAPKRPVRVYIRERREAAGLTQEQLGKRLGVSSGTVSRWEITTNKRRVPSAQVLAAIAEALNIHVSLLFLPLEANHTLGRFNQLADDDQSLVLALIAAIESRRIDTKP